MNYVSTRGDTTPRTFSQAVLEGLASDGGLLVPESLPDFSRKYRDWVGLDYAELAFRILQTLAGDVPESALQSCCRQAYGRDYGGPVAPLTKTGRFHLLELIHGPTLAFKDVALQLLGKLFGEILEERGEHLNIVAATSGDTGSAAIYGMRGIPRVKLFVTHPDGRIAPLQRLQMSTVLDDSIFNIAVSGTFDDCQQMVKDLSSDLKFKSQYHIGAVNSINFARIAAQIVYYFAAYLQTEGASEGVPAVFAVPTGNFGNILAAEYARRMGLPIAGLVLASNENRILPDFFQTGKYRRGEARSTYSPAMDIQVASNFERYLHLCLNGDGLKVQELMSRFSSGGELECEPTDAHLWRAFACSDEQTVHTITSVAGETDRLLDPHTATAWWAMEQCDSEFPPEYPRIVVATAHPAKFPDVCRIAVPSGHRDLTHPKLEVLLDKPERLFHLSCDSLKLKDFVVQGIAEGSEGVFSSLEEKAGRHG